MAAKLPPERRPIVAGTGPKTRSPEAPMETITRNQAVRTYTGYSCIGLDNPKGPENVGSIMRAAGCYGVNTVFYTGKRYERANEFRTDTKKVHLQLPLIGVDDLQAVIPLGCVPVAIEVHPDAKPLTEYQHPERAFYIFGPEDGGLSAKITAWCRDIVYVPTHGCMNLAATVNVVLYDRLAKASRKAAKAERATD
jgi:tRNA(Leu) C34 or U34 (ribose-2'-O)-methylase TrmL